ncbi:MAG TPA: LysM peptidoglycan-binding domain-containing protein, partial [Bacteroidales bacterium]|nr:LysM peptidoglycan-binding domain-containing protein [Bacteroidales bacterium]
MKAKGFIVGLAFLVVQITVLAQGTSTQDRLKQMRSTVIEKQDGKEYYIHTIQRGQTLYMISKAYGVDVNEIIRENPLVKDGIKADEKLRIPVPGQKPVVKPAAAKEKAAEKRPPEKVQKETPPADTLVPELPCGVDSSSKKTVYRVALMLPLYLDGVDQINTDNPDPSLLEKVKSFQFLPYYEGFLLAMDSLAKTGLKVKLYMYDADKDTAKTRQLLKKPEMKSMDLIFGLLYQANFKMVASYARKNKINLVNPISEKSELVTGNPYVYKVQPPLKSQATELADYLARACNDGPVLIVRNGQFKDKEAPERLQKECKERKLPSSIVEGRQEALLKLSKGKPNYVVAFSDDPAYALDFMRDLYRMRNEYNLTMFGLPKWSDMDELESEYLVALKTHMMDA